jgi:hypothetical protein
MEKELSKSVARDEDDLERLESILIESDLIDTLERINKAAEEMNDAPYERFMDPIEGRYFLKEKEIDLIKKQIIA